MLTYIEMLISGELIVLCKLNFHKKRKKTARHTCFRVTLAFADYERQRNRRGTGYYAKVYKYFVRCNAGWPLSSFAFSMVNFSVYGIREG